MEAPSAIFLFVCTKPEQVRSKQPVDMYESFYTTIKKPKINVYVSLDKIIIFSKDKKKNTNSNK
jgi:hypothetical protein